MYCLQSGQLDGFSLLSADSYRLMQIISGLQNFDRSNVASVVTAADKVLIMHFSFNVYYCILQTSLGLNNKKNKNEMVLPGSL
jgi:hypothetical protein